MGLEGEAEANWIIEKVVGYAKASLNPYTARELAILRTSLSGIDEFGLDELRQVNSKTVRMIRGTIEDEKGAGEPCAKARDGLFIPSEWKENYLGLYNSEISWFISGCAQNAMFFDQSLGETENWKSPAITMGFRSSLVKKSDGEDSDSELPLDEFELLNLAIQEFFNGVKLIHLFHSLFGYANGRESPDLESINYLARVDVMSILMGVGDLDDDVTASFLAFVLGKEIHESGIDQRERLRTNTKFGSGQILSRSKLAEYDSFNQNLSSDPSHFYLGVVLTLDRICHQLGVEPLASKIYAAKSAMLALAVMKSSVFCSSPFELTVRAANFGKLLKSCVEVVENPNLKSLTDIDVVYVMKSKFDQMTESALFDVLILSDEISACLSDWKDSFADKCNKVAGLKLFNREGQTEISDVDAEDVGDAHLNDEDYGIFGPSDELEDKFKKGTQKLGTQATRATSIRLKELENLLQSGLITESEFNKKRQAIIDEI